MSAAAPPTAAVDTEEVDREKRKAIRRAIGAGSIGNFVEQFDYGLYGFMAPVLAPAFFPDSDPAAAVLSTYAIIAIACLFRPAGGTLVGRWGDRVGRKKTLLWTIVFMGVTTALIGVLPTYQQIGIFAPLCLLLLRVVQGMVSGGEYVGAVAFIVEWAEPRRRAYYASYASNSCFVGILAGAGTAALTSWLFEGPALDSWGWRIPVPARASAERGRDLAAQAHRRDTRNSSARRRTAPRWSRLRSAMRCVRSGGRYSPSAASR